MSFISLELGFEGYDVTVAKDGEEALALFSESEFDLVIVDWTLLKYDGITVVRRIKKDKTIPILMMTAKSDTSDIVMSLDSGIDDYITKLFDINVFFARIRALQRRYTIINDYKSQSHEYHVGNAVLNVEMHALRCNDMVETLPQKEFLSY